VWHHGSRIKLPLFLSVNTLVTSSPFTKTISPTELHPIETENRIRFT
jgi:hypothetical protein